MERLHFDNKKAIGEKGYSGKRYKDVVSTLISHDDYYVKKFKSRALKRHEHFNGKIKRFAAMNERFRDGPHQFKYHSESICLICRYQFVNGMPLYDILIDTFVE
jgi:hypothetical protein